MSNTSKRYFEKFGNLKNHKEELLDRMEEKIKNLLFERTKYNCAFQRVGEINKEIRDLEDRIYHIKINL